MFVRNDAVTPGLSRKCDTTFIVKERPNSGQQLRVAARRVQSVTIPSSRVMRECRSLELRPPPLRDDRFFPSQSGGLYAAAITELALLHPLKILKSSTQSFQTWSDAETLKRAQKSANASAQKSSKGRKRRKRALTRKNCAQPGLEQPVWEL